MRAATMPRMADERTPQACDVCGGVDDHPRHTILHGDGQAPATAADVVRAVITNAAAGDAVVADLLARDRTVRHIDCCAASGCTVCQASEAVTGGSRGADLIECVTAPEHAAALAQRLGTDLPEGT